MWNFVLSKLQLYSNGIAVSFIQKQIWKLHEVRKQTSAFLETFYFSFPKDSHLLRCSAALQSDSW
jgi:hypothetical protein